jgi:hypothetical protein
MCIVLCRFKNSEEARAAKKKALDEKISRPGEI